MRTHNFNAGIIPAIFLFTFIFSGEAFADPLPVSIYSTQRQSGVWLNEIGSSVTVIGEEEIKNSGAVTAADILRRVPGVNVSQSGGLGGFTQVRMRGSEANHVLLIVDGVKYNDPSGVGYDFSGLLAGNIEHVEVVRGPQSGIFGSGAHAGVIAITTKSGKGLRKPIFEGNVEAGSLGSVGSSLFGAGGNGTAWGSLAASGVATQGYNFASNGTEKDAASIGSLQLRLGATPTDGLNVDGSLRYAAREGNYDEATFGNPADPPLLDSALPHYREGDIAGYGGVTYRAPGSTFEQHAEIQSYGFLRKQVDGIGPFNSEGTRNEALYRASNNFITPDFAQGRHDVSVQLSDEWLDYETNFQPNHSMNSTGLAGEIRSSFYNSTFLSAALRHDISQRFTDATTYRFTARQNMDYGFALRGAIGTGVTNPTLDELYGSSSNFIGNPALKPEQSFEWEIGATESWPGAPITTGITYFNGVTTDEIRTVSLGFPQTTAVNDVGASPRQGVEFLLSYAPMPGLNFTGTYTYTDAKTATGLEETRRPPHSASFDMLWQFLDGKGTLDLGIAYNGRRADEDFRSFPASRVTLDGYTMVNAQISYQITDHAQTYFKLQNTLNAEYEDVFGFRGQPITATAGMRITLE